MMTNPGRGATNVRALRVLRVSVKGIERCSNGRGMSHGVSVTWVRCEPLDGRKGRRSGGLEGHWISDTFGNT